MTALVAIIVAIIGLFLHTASNFSSMWASILQHKSTTIIFLMLVFIFFLRFWSEYRKRIYDSDLANKYQHDFDNPDMINKRKMAAKAIKEELTENMDDAKNVTKWKEKVDDVLDFFEDLGFYVRGDQMSAQVAHHHFYYWLRSYWLLSKKYINHRREEEPEQWKNVEYLFKITAHIEKGWFIGMFCIATEELLVLRDKDQFLKDEKQLEV
jgi:hypothetical protein